MYAGMDHTDGTLTAGDQLLPLWKDRGRPRQEALSLREMQGGFILRPGKLSHGLPLGSPGREINLTNGT